MVVKSAITTLIGFLAPFIGTILFAVAIFVAIIGTGLLAWWTLWSIGII